MPEVIGYLGGHGDELATAHDVSEEELPECLGGEMAFFEGEGRTAFAQLIV